MINIGGRLQSNSNNNSNIPQADNTAVNKIDSNNHSTQQTAGKNAFFRYAGYDDAEEFKALLTKLYADTKNDGVFIDKPVLNPSSPEVQNISQSIDEDVTNITAEVVTSVLGKLKSKGLLDLTKINVTLDVSEASVCVMTVLDKMRAGGASENILKNTLIKLACWCIRYTTYPITNILYIGSASKYEIYWLYLMNSMGCRVTYVNIENNDNYASADSDGFYSRTVSGRLTAPLNFDLKNVNIEDFVRAERMKKLMEGSCSVSVEVRNTPYQELPAKLFVLQTDRARQNNVIPIYMAAYGGIEDEANYRNGLFRLKQELPKIKKSLIVIEKLMPPTYDESTVFMNIPRSSMESMLAGMVDTINIPSSSERTELAKKAFLEMMNTQKEISIQKLFNFAVCVLTWLKNFTTPIDFKTKDIPVLLYYGLANYSEVVFLKFMGHIGFDVLLFCPDKKIRQLFDSSDEFSEFAYSELGHSGEIIPFPTALVKTKISTTAYNAERDLDTLLYNDNTMFRARQFAYCQTATLRTTFEEIDILWNQEAKFRTGFDAKDNLVTVPNIFAKISGVRQGDVTTYWKDVQSKLTPNTIAYNRIPFFQIQYGVNHYGDYFYKNKIDIPKLMASQNNKYTYLSDNVQNLIFNKMQETVDSGFLNIPYPDIMHLVIKTGLFLTNDMQRLIQKFDFTKEVPKLVIVDVVRQTFSVYECILLVMLNLIGFDIIIYTPTGYKNIEQYISPNAFEQYTMDEFLYDMSPPHLKPPKEVKHKGGLFRRK